MPILAPSSVLVTGARGNLGRKIIEALAAESWCTGIVGLDLSTDPSGFSPVALSKLRLHAGDLANADAPWVEALAGMGAVIHLAAENPDVDATWQQAANSFDQTINVGLAALRHGVGRLVFASSNHVMGGYKDVPLASRIGPGALTTSLPPAPGTKWHDGTADQDSTPYATAKLMGERFYANLATHSGGRLTTVAIRIGWAQPGENRAGTISHAGSTLGGFPDAASETAQRDLRWFRGMWLANADLGALFTAAVAADPSAWPGPAIVVNGMSANRDMDWDIATTRQLIGYRPEHDLYAELEM